MWDGTGVYVQSVLRHWVAWGTGSLAVLVVYILDSIYEWKIPKTWLVVFLAAAFLVSGFQAWQEQYKENEGGRSAGALAFVGVAGELNRHGNLADPQMEIRFKNLQNRLLEYHVDNMEVSVSSLKANPVFTNRGGYVYAGQESSFRASILRDVPLDKEPLTGEITYSITYHFVGSNLAHHTQKSLMFDLYYSKELSGKYTTLKEFED